MDYLKKEKDKYRKKNKFQKMQTRYGDQVGSFSLQENSQIKDGIVAERKSTDTMFGICLIVFTCLWVVLSIYSYTSGSISGLLHVNDIDGRYCGTDIGGPAVDYPFMYFSDPDAKDSKGKSSQAQVFKSGVCVKSCPLKDQTTECLTNSVVTTCPKGTGFDTMASYSVCTPELGQLSGALKESGESMQKFMDVFTFGVGVTFVSLLLCMALNIGFIKLLSAHPTVMCKVCIAGVELMLIVGTLAGVYRGLTTEDQGEKSSGFQMALFFFAQLLVVNCMLWCYADDLETAIAVIDCSADFYNDTKRLMFVSLAYGVALVVIALVTVWTCCMLYSLVKPPTEIDRTQGNNGQWAGRVQIETPMKVMICIVIFTGAWLCQFTKKMLAYISMYACATYYWASGQSGSAHVMGGIQTGHKFHFGSVALGSLIQALVEMLTNASEAGRNSDGCNAVSATVCTCCLRCFGAAFEALSAIAYANMAISGDKFCTSAWNGFLLNLRHLGKFFLAHYIGGALIVLGKMFIVGVCVAFTMVIVIGTQRPPEGDDSAFVGAVVAVGLLDVLLLFVFTSMFLGLFDEAIICTLQCLVIDMDLNGGKPKYGSESFRGTFEKISSVEETQDNLEDPSGQSQIQLQQQKQEGLQV